jgi:transcriptional regulator with XRE-family HTH domain
MSIVCDIIPLVVYYNAQFKGGDSIRLAQVRKSKGLTQEQLSALSGVSRVSIARYETGAISPTIRNLLKLSSALKVPVDKLIDRKGA